MHLRKPEIDYRRVRFTAIHTAEYKHLKLLLFWPMFGMLFQFVEHFYQVESYTVMHCALDDWIPFCEWFLIPYLFWFFYMGGMFVYTLLYDIDGFCRMMKYIMLTYSITIVIYLLWPTCQELRPDTFLRENVLTEITKAYYRFDTNTNVCPSIHVIGSLAVMEAALWSKKFSKAWKASFVFIAILICMSTVFMKQHSVLDILAALPICAVGHCFWFRTAKTHR